VEEEGIDDNHRIDWDCKPYGCKDEKKLECVKERRKKEREKEMEEIVVCSLHY
jgi:hypothetical protein